MADRPAIRERAQGVTNEITAAKFRLEQACRMPHPRPTPPTTGLLCRHHATVVLDVFADVHDLWIRYTEGDIANPPPLAGGGRSTSPHPAVPIRLNTFLIANPGGEPVGILPARNAHPVTGRIESNGPDAPDIPSTIYHWADRIVLHLDIDWPGGDLLARLDFTRRHLADATMLDDFDDLLRGYRACRRALAAAIGDEPGPLPLGKCPECRADLYTDCDQDIRRRRRNGEDTGDPKGKRNRVECGCGAVWEGPGFSRLMLILNPGRGPSPLRSIRAGTGGRS